MRIELNLASEPFRRDRPLLIASGVAGLLLLFSLITFIWMAWSDRSLVNQDRQVQARLERELARLRTEKSRYDGEVRKPENAEVLERSVMLNQLLLRKSISWTKLFADLEKTLPPNVRITQIRPQVNGERNISLEMTVASETPDPLVVFVQKLEQSNVFSSVVPRVSQAPSQTDPFYRYRLTVNYAQKL
jgi:Tfp pilus assembly protein PilN